MKQLANYKVEEKLFTSSLNICQEGGGGRQSNASPPPSTPPYFPADPLDISLKDDVTGILLLGVSFYDYKYNMHYIVCTYMYECKAAKKCTLHKILLHKSKKHLERQQ
jgi:hypothetical protein